MAETATASATQDKQNTKRAAHRSDGAAHALPGTELHRLYIAFSGTAKVIASLHQYLQVIKGLRRSKLVVTRHLHAIFNYSKSQEIINIRDKSLLKPGIVSDRPYK